MICFKLIAFTLVALFINAAVFISTFIFAFYFDNNENGTYLHVW